jgi:hypothetical protein
VSSKSLKMKSVSWETRLNLALLRTGRLSPADFSLHFDFAMSAIEDKIRISCSFQQLWVWEWCRTMKSTNDNLLFKEALQNPKCLLLFCGGAVLDDTMKFSSQESWICFLRLEFEERRR